MHRAELSRAASLREFFFRANFQRMFLDRGLPMKYEIEVLDSETGYDGFFELKRFRLRHSLYAGGWSEEIERERVERLQAASVLLYDPERDHVVMIEQFRIGALESGPGAWLLEVIGGLDAGLGAQTRRQSCPVWFTLCGEPPTSSKTISIKPYRTMIR